MDAAGDPSIREIWVMKSAQVGWTEILNNVVGYHVHQDPCPMMLVQPTLDMGQAWSKDRLAPMIRDTPALKGKVKDARARDSGNTLLHKTFDGGHITIAGANSPASLASRPVRLVLLDECDRFPTSAGPEGDPVRLVAKRMTAFWNKKLFAGSTPTVADQSRIERGFENSDKRYFFVPCFHCAHMQRLIWGNVKFSKEDPRAATYQCEKCLKHIDNSRKTWMVARGEWRATVPFAGIAGFHISELYSPFVSWGETADDFLEAKKTPETLQVWVNTALGEVWKESGDAPDWEAVAAHKAPYKMGEVPRGALAVVAGVDVQKDRLVYVVRAFGLDMASWLLEHGELWGATDQKNVWAKLSALIGPSKIDVTADGDRIKRSLTIWNLDTDFFKTWVHGRIDWPVDESGAWLIPEDVTQDYCEQIVAEGKTVLPNGKPKWIQTGPNHYLDAEMNATAAAYVLQLHRTKPGSRRRKAAGTVSEGIDSVDQ